MEQWKLAAVMGAVALGGVAVGGWLCGVDHARAQEARPAFRECFVARQETVDTNNEGAVEPFRVDHIVTVPAGWTPISGGGGATSHGHGAVVFCR